MLQRGRRTDGLTKRPELNDPTVNGFNPLASITTNLFVTCMTVLGITHTTSMIQTFPKPPTGVTIGWNLLTEYAISSELPPVLLGAERGVAALAMTVATLSSRSWREVRESSVRVIIWEAALETRLTTMLIFLGIISGINTTFLALTTWRRQDSTYLLFIPMLALHFIIAALPSVMRTSGASLVRTYTLQLTALERSAVTTGDREFTQIVQSAKESEGVGSNTSRSTRLRRRSTRATTMHTRHRRNRSLPWFVIPTTSGILLFLTGAILRNVWLPFGNSLIGISLSCFTLLFLLPIASGIFTTDHRFQRVIGSNILIYIAFIEATMGFYSCRTTQWTVLT